MRVKTVLGVKLQKVLNPPRSMKLESLAWDFIRAGRYGLIEVFIHDRLSKTCVGRGRGPPTSGRR
jgi:hypothetical protein